MKIKDDQVQDDDLGQDVVLDVVCVMLHEKAQELQDQAKDLTKKKGIRKKRSKRLNMIVTLT